MYNIKNLFLFQGMAECDVDAITASLPQAKTFSRGDVIYSPDGFSRAMGVFLSGTGTAKSDDVVKAVFSEGSVFGAAALFGAKDAYISRIEAKTECTVQLIPEETVRALVLTHPTFAENYIVFLSDRIRYLNRKIKQYTGDSASDRLLRYLYDNSDGGRVFAANMAELARLTGMGRTSLYRALAELEKEGAAKRDGSYIILTEEN